MIRIQHKWGADYLVYNTPVNLRPVTLTSVQGIHIVPGTQLRKIGKRPRTAFELKDGFTMAYEGLLDLDSMTYAIFRCRADYNPQPDLFGTHTQYRYAVACVFQKSLLHCFLLGAGGYAGCVVGCHQLNQL